MIYNLSCNDYKLEKAFDLINDIETNNYYFFTGSYLPQANASLQPVYDNVSNTLVQAYTNMIQGKAIANTNVYLMINNVQWAANTVYAMYNDQDPNLINEQFFIITQEGSYAHYWKCLDNNFNSESIIQPLFAYATDTPYYQTTDGYRWKYMTSFLITDAESNFNDSNYYPITANSVVAAAAIPGALDIFLLQSNGAFYNNYIYGTFVTTDISVNGDPTLFNISNNQVVTTNGFYTGCLLYISGGTGQGQYANVVDYTSNTTGNIITLDQPMLTTPQNGTTFEITPQLSIVSDGNQTINCVARALVNSLSSNSIYRIESLQPGENYIYVANVSVISNVVVGVTNNAIIQAIASPRGGHGANVYAEFYCNSIGLSITLSNTENDTILTNNIYQQIGIMKNPLFANVNLIMSGVNGDFEMGEILYSFTNQQFDTHANVVSGTSNISSNTANFVNQLVVGDYVYLSAVGGGSTQLVQVANVVNTSTITINSNALFSCTVAIMAYATFTGNCISVSGGTSNVNVTNCTPTFLTGSTVIGSQSGVVGTITGVTRNGIAEYFPTFIQLTNFAITQDSGTFIQSEQVLQGNNTAYLFFANASNMYLSNFIGDSFSNGTVTGNTSGAIATITTAYVPDIVYGSADIFYLENINAVTRANTQNETFQIVLNL